MKDDRHHHHAHPTKDEKRAELNYIIEQLNESRLSGTASLEDIPLTLADVTSLARALDVNRTIKMLDLTGTGIGAEHIAQLTKCLWAGSTVIKHLSIENNPKIGPAGIALLTAALEHNTILRVLMLENVGMGDEGAQHLATLLRHNMAIRFLFLKENHIGTPGLLALASTLKTYNRTVEFLDLRGNLIVEEAARAIAEALTVNDVLTDLVLGAGNKLGPGGTRCFTGVLRFSTTLLRLFLRENQLGPEGGAALLEGLRDNRTIIVLFLGSNNLDSEFSEGLADCIERGLPLEVVELTNNPVGPSGASHFARVLPTSKLRQLYMDETQMGIVGANYLAEGLEKGAPCLLQLLLRGNDLREEGAHAVVSALQRSCNTTLMLLDLTKNNIPDDVYLAVEKPCGFTIDRD